MRLILVRHGETEYNTKDLITGHHDVHLTEKGIEQARAVARMLEKEHIDAAYISDLHRTRQTAEEILKYHPGTKVEYTSLLREQNSGIYQGQKSGIKHRVAAERLVNYVEFKPEGGESLTAMHTRVNAFMCAVEEKNPDKTVLFVSHGGPILNLLMHLHGDTDENFKKYHPQNTAVSILEIEHGKLVKVHSFNKTAHLENP
jgi:broad specificity phosphatase PhoE